MPGLRLNYDQKDVNFDQQVYGGLQTTDPVLVALKLSVLAPQAYVTDVDDTNLSGQATVAYKVADPVNTYATYATSFKSVGLNLNGLPTDALGNPVLSAATVKPEDVRHIEVGVKTNPFRGVTTNVSFFDTEIDDYQTQVVNASVGVLRGYLANAERVRVRGLEVDAAATFGRAFSTYVGMAFTDGKYVSFTGCTAPARGNRRSPGEGRVGHGPAGHLQASHFVRRRVREARPPQRPVGPVLRGVRHQLPLVVLVELQRVGLSRSWTAIR